MIIAMIRATELTADVHHLVSKRRSDLSCNKMRIQKKSDEFKASQPAVWEFHSTEECNERKFRTIHCEAVHALRRLSDGMMSLLLKRLRMIRLIVDKTLSTTNSS